MDSPIPKEQAIEGNKIIANFMGHTELISQHGIKGKYHMSWDWLVPVIQVIKEKELGDKNIGGGTDLFIMSYNKQFISVIDGFSTCYRMVIEYIKAYNRINSTL